MPQLRVVYFLLGEIQLIEVLRPLLDVGKQVLRRDTIHRPFEFARMQVALIWARVRFLPAFFAFQLL